MSLSNDIVIWLLIFFILFIILGLYIAENKHIIKPIKPMYYNPTLENYENPQQSTDDDIEKGAPEYYKWGEQKPINIDIPNPFNKTKTIINEVEYVKCQPPPPPEMCYNCDITTNKDIDKYVLKRSVPPCPNMNNYIHKNKIPTCPNMDEYIHKNKIPLCPNMNNYILKSNIPEPPDMSEYMKKDEVLKNYIRKDEVMKNYIKKDKCNEICKEECKKICKDECKINKKNMIDECKEICKEQRKEEHKPTEKIIIKEKVKEQQPTEKIIIKEKVNKADTSFDTNNSASNNKIGGCGIYDIEGNYVAYK